MATIDTSPDALMARPDWDTLKSQITGGMTSDAGREQMLTNATNLGLSPEQAAQVVNTALGGNAAFNGQDVSGWAPGGTNITSSQVGTSSPTYDSTNTPDWNALHQQITANWGTPEGQAAIFARGKTLGLDDNAMAQAINRATGSNYSAAQIAGWGGKNVMDPAKPPIQPGIIGGASLGTPTPWNVTPEQTVEGRIASIINPNSPLMVQQQTQAAQASNAHGVINSSMAVTAGQDAMLRAATPIAAADAATFAKAAGYNADESNQFAVHAFDANTQRGIAQLQSDTQQKIAALDATTRTTIATQQNENQVLLNTSGQAAQAFNQYVVAAANIQNNPNLDAANKNAALQTLWTTTRSQLTVLGKLTGLDLTSLLDMTAFNAAPAPAPAPPAGIVSGVAANSGSSGAGG